MTTPQALAIDVTMEGSRAVVAPKGEIDYGNVAQLRGALVDLSQGDATEVIVDLGGVTFVDSTALSVLVQAKQRLEESNRRMSVVEPLPRVLRVLELAGLRDYLVEG